MLHKLLQLRSLRLARLSALSVFGDGLAERLRSTLVVMLGLTAAVGLALVAIALQQGFPLVASGQIPDPPAAREAARDRAVPRERPAAARRDATPAPAVDDVTAVAPAEGPGGVGPVASPPSEAVPVLVTDTPSTGAGQDRKRPSGRAPASPRQAAQTPPAAPEEEPTATPSSEAPEAAPEPEPEPEPAASSHPGKGNAYGKGNGNGVGSSGSPPSQGSPGNSGSPPGHE